MVWFFLSAIQDNCFSNIFIISLPWKKGILHVISGVILFDSTATGEFEELKGFLLKLNLWHINIMKYLCNTVDYSLKTKQETKIFQVLKWQKMLIAKEISTCIQGQPTVPYFRWIFLSAFKTSVSLLCNCNHMFLFLTFETSGLRCCASEGHCLPLAFSSLANKD